MSDNKGFDLAQLDRWGDDSSSRSNGADRCLCGGDQ